MSDYNALDEQRYVHVKVLGRGAFGEAVLYRKIEDDTLVVWKEIDLTRLTERQRRDTQNEIEILSMLDHANITTYYNHFLDGNNLFIEMEYANDGSLYHKILHRDELFDEETVLWYFYQLVDAVVHIHENGILHRDIKTLNIFLTKAQILKLGDFGIAKCLDPDDPMAVTCVGTPYYMSPELIKGKPYDQKSDVWAIGCVLNELLTLKRTFEATNALRLASEICHATVGEIDPRYSEDIRAMLHHTLEKEPAKRPTAEEILGHSMLLARKDNYNTKIRSHTALSRQARSRVSVVENPVPVVTSRLCEVYVWGGGKVSPQRVEFFKEGFCAIQVVTSQNHYAAITVEDELFTWSSGLPGSSSQSCLGHSDAASSRVPRKVATLNGIAVKQVSAGLDFTVCLTAHGEVYSFGSNYYGILGNGDPSVSECATPMLVEYFNDKTVLRISCGDNHVVALTSDDGVHTWGCNEFGRLGLGHEDDQFAPKKVTFRGKYHFRSVCAGADGTFLWTKEGRVLAFGSNEHNKLGFNTHVAGLRTKENKCSYDIPCTLSPSTVKPLIGCRIVEVAAGAGHSACIDEYGYLYTFGSNSLGQLGVGDFKPRPAICRVAADLAGCKVIRVACGDTFTICATDDNRVFSWGNGDDGRLGVRLVSSGKQRQSMSATNNCVSLPRPIFGSLYAVSSLSSRHWHTILIAEQLIGEKAIRASQSTASFATSKDTEGSDNAFVSIPQLEIQSPKDGPSQPFSPGMEETAPEWLKAEMQNAEFIPIRSKSPTRSMASLRAKPPSLPEELKNELKLQLDLSDDFSSKWVPSHAPSDSMNSSVNVSSEKADLIYQLREDMAKLNTENCELRLRVQELEATVQRLMEEKQKTG